MTLKEFMERVYPQLESKLFDKIEKQLAEGDVKAYWAGTIIRIDIKPREKGVMMDDRSVTPGFDEQGKGELFGGPQELV